MKAAVLVKFLWLLSVSWVCSALSVKTFNATNFTLVTSCLQSSVYSVDVPTTSGYDHPPLLVHLTGSRYDMGYAYGYMLASAIQESYHDQIAWLLKGIWSVFTPVLEFILDRQWDHHLSKQVPTAYLTELSGLTEGAAKAGCSHCGRYITRGYVVANLPADINDIEKLLRSENSSLPEGLAARLSGPLCSMLAMWGSRTQQGTLFSARNLDWHNDTGINKYKMVLVTVPNDGGHPSASVGFVGMYGPLAGMSSQGLTVHEANLEVDKNSLNGFPWALRLRYIMEFASDIQSARQLWESTNNTIGFNHMISSGKDASAFAHNGGHSVVALVMETMYGYTAYFHDDDPRESDAMYTPPKGNAVHIGFPLPEALWRTNHGYDPVIRQRYQWSEAPSSWSNQRYIFIHNTIKDYQDTGVKIGALEALNITAIAGDKGSHAYSCTNNTDGINILSTVFQPQDNITFVAWEQSSGSSWQPAACSEYVRFDLTKWFTAQPPVDLLQTTD